MTDTWKKLLEEEKEKEYFKKLEEFLDKEYEENEIYPERKNLYNALDLTSYEGTNVIILGQDPYHGPHQAHGLSFSIESEKAKFPPSLRNMFKELKTDLDIERTERNLTDWAEQGVLLLNTVLTVQAGKAASHRKKGWETFTDTIIKKLIVKMYKISSTNVIIFQVKYQSTTNNIRNIKLLIVNILVHFIMLIVNILSLTKNFIIL